jgi:hypothetical protein
MALRLQILVYENRQLKESAEFDGPVELGRVRSREDRLYTRSKATLHYRDAHRQDREAKGWRWDVANGEEVAVSRNQMVVEPLADRVYIYNGSDRQPIRFLDQPDLRPTTGREFSLPVILVLGTRTLRLQRLDSTDYRTVTRESVRVRAVQPLALAGGVNTPDYLAPWQIEEPPEGAEKQVADDLHSVAVMGYQMLLGRLPFPTEPLMARLEAIAQRRFDSAVDGCRLLGIDAALARSIDQALAGGYPSAAAWKADLDRLPGPAPPPRPAAPAPRPERGEKLTIDGLLFEDVLSEAYEVRGQRSDARCTLRLFKPGFHAPAFLQLLRDLPATGNHQAAPAAGILQRFLVGRARPLPVRNGAEVEVDPDLESAGCPCLVEELAGNQTLMDLIQSGRLTGDATRTRDLLGQLLGALGYAHQNGCVHGNLTPYCAFVGSDDRVKVEGFGLHAELEVLRVQQGGDSHSVSSIHPRATATYRKEITARDAVEWMHAALGALQAATDCAGLFAAAARSLLDLGGLDAARVILRDGDGWRVQALEVAVPVDPSRLRGPSLGVLKRVCLERKTFWDVPREAEAVVAAPLLDGAGEVVGTLYGERLPSESQFTEVEVMLVDLLARGVAAGLARLEQEREAVVARVRFEQFVTPDLARQLASHPEMLEPREREVTVQFCRIVVNLASAWCRKVLDMLSACVLAEGGVLVDFIGDGLMAMWEGPDHADRACRAALAMLESTDVGIGINTGTALVGNVGSSYKFKYGAVGDTVDLANRVQGLTRSPRPRVLLTASTHAKLGDAFLTRRLDEEQVGGVFELIPTEPAPGRQGTP